MTCKQRINKLKRIKAASFTTKTGTSVGLSYYDLQLLMKDKYLHRISRGIYGKESSDLNEDEELASSLVHVGEPSCVCLLSALYFHDITDEIPNQDWLYVPLEKSTRKYNIKIIRKKNPYWKVGIERVKDIKVTTIERTLIDCLTDKRHFTQLDAIKYTKIALKERLTDIKSLFAMAKKLKVDHRVKMILTMLQEEYV
jgi:predicted transcriptional regulator of viral defense system